MKPGQVVHVRISPQDCLACVDIVKAIGINTTNMSFALVVKIALASCLESMRQNNVIPKRTGFEFTDMMAPFKEFRAQRQASKLHAARIIDSIGDKFQPPAIVPTNPELERVRSRMDELAFKREQDEMNFTREDQQEWEQLTAQLFAAQDNVGTTKE